MENARPIVNRAPLSTYVHSQISYLGVSEPNTAAGIIQSKPLSRKTIVLRDDNLFQTSGHVGYACPYRAETSRAYIRAVRAFVSSNKSICVGLDPNWFFIQLILDFPMTESSCQDTQTELMR